MEKKIRNELLKMTGIMLVLAGLGIYAHEFVIAGIQAKVALNSSIFLIFGVAASLAFKPVLALKNDAVALRALQVDYGQKHTRAKDPYARAAVVFQEPELLGQGYRLITEELARQDDLQLSSSDVQTLLHDVDARINDRKSTILYFSGLMVFLGLLGAFMGLMKTVHAVSDLIGAMDISGNAGTDSFGKMIEGMKAPLAGMSVGFSSSLFGLVTSMVLGALERCMTSALKSLRNEFEHWLSHVTALDGGQGESGGHGSPGELAAMRRVLDAGAGQLREMRAAMDAGQLHTRQLSNGLDGLTRATTRLADTVLAMTDPSELLRPVTATITELGRNQIALLGQIRGLHAEAQADRADMRAMLEAMDARIARSEALDGRELHRQLDRLISAQDELAAREPTPIVVTLAGRGGVAGRARIPRLFRALLGWLRVIQGDPAAARREARRLRREVRLALGRNNRASRRQHLAINARLDRIVAQARDSRDILAHLERMADLPQDTPAGGNADSFRDARMAMDVLQRRLNADVEPLQPAGDFGTTAAAAPPRRQEPHS